MPPSSAWVSTPGMPDVLLSFPASTYRCQVPARHRMRVSLTTWARVHRSRVWTPGPATRIQQQYLPVAVQIPSGGCTRRWRNHPTASCTSTSGSLASSVNASNELRRAPTHSPNQILGDLAIEAFDRRERPGTETEMLVARASLFGAQAIARQLIADGCENEVQEIRNFISTIVPDPDAREPASSASDAPSTLWENDAV